MTCTYDEMYLNDVQKNMGFFFQLLLQNLELSPKETQEAFLNSIIPEQIENANPDFLCGKSGYELGMIALPQMDLSKVINDAIHEPFYPKAEYWTGFTLAFCQWKNNIPFATILKHYSVEQFLKSYRLLHEADITKVEQIIMEKVKNQKN